jgi:hypothetical protein
MGADDLSLPCSRVITRQYMGLVERPFKTRNAKNGGTPDDCGRAKSLTLTS